MFSNREKELMFAFIKEHYSVSGLKEDEFARLMARCLRFKVSPSTMRNLRIQLGIPLNDRMSAHVHYEGWLQKILQRYGVVQPETQQM